MASPSMKKRRARPDSANVADVSREDARGGVKNSGGTIRSKRPKKITKVSKGY